MTIGDRLLVLVRHGQSEGNARNQFTGWLDAELTPLGRQEASRVGQALQNLQLSFDVAFTSELRRTVETCLIMADKLSNPLLIRVSDPALNERDYGSLSGLNKDEARERWGEQQVRTWRRAYDIAPPGGESLRDTVARCVPFFLRSILPCVMRCEHTLVVTHGNIMRALSMTLEGLTAKEIESVEFATGDLLIYRFDSDTTIGERHLLSSAGTVEAPLALTASR